MSGISTSPVPRKFSARPPPLLPYTRANITDLAREVIRSQTTLNGRKRKLRRNDFMQAMTASGLDEKVIDNLFRKFINSIPKWNERVDISFLPDEMKYKYKALIAARIG